MAQHKGRRRPPSDPEARERALEALALSRREGFSVSRSARLTRTTPRTVLRYAGPGFERKGRRWKPRPFDRLPRQMTVLTEAGPIEAMVRDSRTASLLAEHANAVQIYLRSGDETALRNLPRRDLQLGGRRLRLPVEPAILDGLAAGGELHYELYRR